MTNNYLSVVLWQASKMREKEISHDNGLGNYTSVEARNEYQHHDTHQET